MREFQRVSHLSLSGKLDASTVHQMRLPRCGVNDAGSFEAWTERVDALFSGRRAEKKRRKRYSHQNRESGDQSHSEKQQPGAFQVFSPKLLSSEEFFSKLDVQI
ncbi:UNVERIFIED_CONTAM: hypothetical protein K2H54_023995 [Gekko kuhli]